MEQMEVEQMQSKVSEYSKSRVKRKEFNKLLKLFQSELVEMQEWVKASIANMRVVFEGRDTTGEVGIIKRITEGASPRPSRVFALEAPMEKEKS